MIVETMHITPRMLLLGKPHFCRPMHTFKDPLLTVLIILSLGGSFCGADWTERPGTIYRCSNESSVDLLWNYDLGATTLAAIFWYKDIGGTQTQIASYLGSTFTAEAGYSLVQVNTYGISITDFPSSSAGTYQCALTLVDGSTPSNDAVLFVTVPPDGPPTLDASNNCVLPGNPGSPAVTCSCNTAECCLSGPALTCGPQNCVSLPDTTSTTQGTSPTTQGTSPTTTVSPPLPCPWFRSSLWWLCWLLWLVLPVLCVVIIISGCCCYHRKICCFSGSGSRKRNKDDKENLQDFTNMKSSVTNASNGDLDSASKADSQASGRLNAPIGGRNESVLAGSNSVTGPKANTGPGSVSVKMANATQKSSVFESDRL